MLFINADWPAKSYITVFLTICFDINVQWGSESSLLIRGSGCLERITSPNLIQPHSQIQISAGSQRSQQRAVNVDLQTVIRWCLCKQQNITYVTEQ